MKSACEEVFDVVNDNDEVIGTGLRSEVHCLGLYHRATHVLVFNSLHELFLQKRSLRKESDPGLWDTSVAGHVGAGESYEQCALRELDEEIAISPRQPLRPLFKIDACPETGSEFVWVYRCSADGPFMLNPDEIERGGWFHPKEIDAWLTARPQDFTPTFKIIWKRLQAAGLE